MPKQNHVYLFQQKPDDATQSLPHEHFCLLADCQTSTQAHSNALSSSQGRSLFQIRHLVQTRKEKAEHSMKETIDGPK